jgi:hypothetical protein
MHGKPRRTRLSGVRGTGQTRSRPRRRDPFSIYLLQIVQIYRTVLAREGQPLILPHLLGDAADKVVSRVVCCEFSFLLD